MRMRRRSIFTSLFMLAGISTLRATHAHEPPDLELNPVTGDVESVDIAVDSELVRHTADKGQGGSKIASLVSNGAGGNPRLAIKSTGNTWIAWWTRTPPAEVRYIVRNGSTGGWGIERRLSLVGEDSRNPEIVHSGASAWVAYEIHTGTATSLAAVGIIDDIEPLPQRTIAATTTFTGDVDLLIHAEAGRVWITWVDSMTHVGWSEFDVATAFWNLPQYRSYVSSTVDTIRKSIRDTVVLGQ